jgi:hypothetical protein
MKEARQSTLTTVGAEAPRRWPLEQRPKSAPRSDAAGVSSADEIQTRTSNIVLLFLDLATATQDAAYLDVAKAGAKHLANTWNGLSASSAITPSTDKLSSTLSLSRVAFALAETWRATKNPVYRHAGLNIIRHLAEVTPAAGRESDAVHGGEKR